MKKSVGKDPMSSTQNEDKFLEAYTSEISKILDSYFNPSQQKVSYSTLERTSNVLDIVSAGFVISGVASAPFTFGLGLAAAGAALVLLKAGKICMETIEEYRSTVQLPEDVITVQKELRRLALFLHLRQVGTILLLRYGYALNEEIDLKKGVVEYAQYTAYQVMQELLRSLSTNQTILPDVMHLANYLLSLKQSGLGLSHEITVKPRDYDSPLVKAVMSRKIAAKQLCARGRWVVAETGLSTKVFKVEQSYFQNDSTKPECGYLALNKETVDAPLILAINKAGLIEHVLTATEKNTLLQKCRFQHQVSREDVALYLQSDISRSLNLFISEKYGRPSIAYCDDNRLLGLSLTGGNFSNVNFYSADLTGCDLSGTIFNNATLTRATMHNIILDEHSRFAEVMAEGSSWAQVRITGNFQKASFKGATFEHCRINTTTNLIASDWTLTTLLDVLMVDLSKQEFEQRFALRLQEEHDTKMHISQELESLKKAYTATTINQSQQTTSQIEALQNRITDLMARNELFSAKVGRDLVELGVKCESLAQRISSNTADIERIEVEQNTRWLEQHDRDSLQDYEIATLAAGQDVLQRLMYHWMTEINTDDYRNKKQVYIPLMVSTVAGEVLLTDHIERFLLSNDEQILIIDGESGCGKTFGVAIYFEKLMREHNRDQNECWIPIDLDTSKIRDLNSNVLAAALETVFTKNQVDSLYSKKCIIRLGKLDISRLPFSKLIKDVHTLSEQWTQSVKFIFTMKTSYILRERHNIDNPHQPLKFFPSATIKSLIDAQVNRFFRSFHNQDLVEVCKAYQTTGIVDIQTLTRTPLMLSLVTGVLLGKQPNNPERKSLSRLDFYEDSWRAWHDRVSLKLPDNYQNYNNFMVEMYRLAEETFKKNKDSIEYTFEKKAFAPTRKHPLHELLETKIGSLAPISISRKDADSFYVKFIHPSLGYYLVAVQLMESLFDASFPHGKEWEKWWNIHYLSTIPEILEFLVELLQRLPERYSDTFENIMIQNQSPTSERNLTPRSSPAIVRDKDTIHKRLLQMVRMTNLRNTERLFYKKAASSAFTTLCKWGRTLNGQNFSNLVLSKVDATRGLLAYASFENTDLSESNFYNALLLGANFRNALVTDTRFMNLSRFVDIQESPKAFLVYPSLHDTILIHPVVSDGFFKKHHISISRYTDNKTEQLRLWPAHSQEILAMSIVNVSKIKRLASAGRGGLTRVWDLSVEPPKLIANLSGYKHKPTVTWVAWGPDGTLLATGCDDGYVRIWKIKDQVKKYKSKKHQGEVRSLIWGETTDTLISADDTNHIRMISNASLDNRVIETVPIIGKSQKPIKAIHSLAFSLHEDKLAMGTSHGDICIMSLADKTITIFEGHKNSVKTLTWYGHDTLVSGSDDHTIRIWTGNHIRVIAHEHPIGKLDVLPGCGQIVSGGAPSSSRLYFWNMNQSTPTSNLQDGFGVISCMAVRPHSELEVNSTIATGYVNGSVVLYFLQDMDQPNTPLPQPILEHRCSSVQQLTWSKDARYLASLGKNHDVLIYDFQIKATITMISALENWFTHVAWLLNVPTNTLVIARNDGGLDYYNDSDQFNAPILVTKRVEPTNIAGLLAGRVTAQLAVAVAKKVEFRSPTHIGDVLSDDSPPTCLEHTGSVCLMTWSPDGSFFVVSDDQKSVYLWNAVSSKLLMYYQVRTTDMKAILWTGDWLLLANAKEILFWRKPSELSQQIPKILSMGARFLCESQENIVFARGMGIYYFERSVLPLRTHNAEHPLNINRIKAGFFVDESDARDMKGVSWFTEQLFQSNNSKITPKSLGLALKKQSGKMPDFASKQQVATFFSEKKSRVDLHALFPSTSSLSNSSAAAALDTPNSTGSISPMPGDALI